jgi:hypothetical protein
VGILFPEKLGILFPEKNCGNTVSRKMQEYCFLRKIEGILVPKN